MKYRIAFLSLLLAAVLFRIPTDTAAREAGRDPGKKSGRKVLVIGKVSSNPQKHYRYLKPMADYAAGRMQDLGFEGSAVLMAKDNAQMVEYLRSGRVDWVTDTAFSSLLYEYYDAADIILKKWKKNAEEYRTVFFCRKDRPIRSLSDLKGKKIALEDPGSTTAFYEPFLCLAEQGLPIEKLDSVEQSPSPGKIGYVFSFQEINSSMWVHKRLVDAAAFNNQDWEKNDHMYKNIREGMMIFYESDPMPRAFESVRRDLSPAVKARLKKVLLGAHLDPKAKGALKSYQETKRFTELDANTVSKLGTIRNNLPIVLKAIE